MQVAVSDHKTFDFLSRVRQGDGWRVARLSLTCITDMRSRKILGWWIDEVPSTLTIIRAVKMMVEQYGCPEALLVDNGKDFSSYWFAGDQWNERHHKIGKKEKGEISSVAGDLDMIVQFCTPYRGQSKPIERFFGFVSEEHDREYDSYTGSNTSARLDEHKLYYGSFAGKEKIPTENLPTVEEVRKIFERFVARYNAKWRHSGQGMDNRTPDAVFAENFREREGIPEDYLKYVWTRREIRTVQRGAVDVDGHTYSNSEMGLIPGRQVEMRISIDDIGTAYVFDMKTGTYMYDADCDLLKDSGITEENVRKVNRARKAVRKHINETREELEEIGKDRLTMLEELREEEVRKAAGGEDMAGSGSPALTVVKPKFRTIKGVLGESLKIRES
jgi:transposase InsO family protein